MGYVGSWESQAERDRRSELQSRVDAESRLSSRLASLESRGGGAYYAAFTSDLERRVEDLEKRVKKLEARKDTKNG